MDLNLIHSKYGKDKKSIFKAIADNFVAESDMKTIFKFCIDKKARVTFRKTGATSISQLKKGTAAKPHSILEKSVQTLRLLKSDKIALESIVGKDNLEKILGLVGHWSKYTKQEGNIAKNGLKGLYLTDLAKNALNGDLKPYVPIIKPPNPKKIDMHTGKQVGRKYYFIKLTLSQAEEITLIKNAAEKTKELTSEEDITFAKGPDFELAPYYISYSLSKIFLKKLVSNDGQKLFKYLFAGDYDMHNLSTTKAFAEGSYDEKRLLKELNEKINSSGHRQQILKELQKAGADISDYNMIQHGAQDKYSASMHNHEKGKLIDPKVAKASSDALAACSPDGWEIIGNPDELKEFFLRVGIHLNDEWLFGNTQLDNTDSKDKDKDNDKDEKFPISEAIEKTKKSGIKPDPFSNIFPNGSDVSQTSSNSDKSR